MVFSVSDKAVIQAYWTEKGRVARKIVGEFPGKGWKVVSVHRLINKVKHTGTTERKTGSGRLRTATTEENKQYVEKMFASQKECAGTHKSQRQMAAQSQNSRRSVQRMIKDLGFKALKRIRVSRRDQIFEQNANLDVETSITDIIIKCEYKKSCFRMRRTSCWKLLASDRMTGSMVCVKKTSLHIAFIMNLAALQKRLWFSLVSAAMVRLTFTS